MFSFVEYFQAQAMVKGHTFSPNEIDIYRRTLSQDAYEQGYPDILR